MLKHFNGGELFFDAGPCITVFGLSLPADDPNFDWFIDRFTPKWRSIRQRPKDWVIGMTQLWRPDDPG